MSSSTIMILAITITALLQYIYHSYNCAKTLPRVFALHPRLVSSRENRCHSLIFRKNENRFKVPNIASKIPGIGKSLEFISDGVVEVRETVGSVELDDSTLTLSSLSRCRTPTSVPHHPHQDGMSTGDLTKKALLSVEKVDRIILHTAAT